MTGDDMELESRISEILDRLALEMQQAAIRLRFAPFCTVEEFLKRASTVLRQIDKINELLKTECFEDALRLTQFIEVPEIELQDKA